MIILEKVETIFVNIETIVYLCGMTFKEYIQTFHIKSFSNLGISLWKIDARTIEQTQGSFLDCHAIIIVESGILTISLKGKEYIMTANSYADVMQLNMLQFIAATSQINAWCLAFSEEYFFKTFPSKAPAEMAYVKYIAEHKTLLLDAFHIQALCHVMQSMDDTFADKENIFRDALLQMKMKILFLEIDNIFHHHIDESSDGDADTSRQQYIFGQFVRLLSENAKREHSVDFYADKLCITAQYLGRIVHNFGHDKVYNMIARAVVGEVEIMLADSSIPLKQIATEMNFSDQSVFTKFFKRQTGKSPMQYRNCLID